MKKRLLILLVLALALMPAGLFAAAGDLDPITAGGVFGTDAGEWIMGMTINVTYRSAGGNVATTDAKPADVSVNAIYGYDPLWEEVPSQGIEPSQVASFNYQIRNVSNLTTPVRFNVTWNVIAYTGSVAGDWTITATTRSILLSEFATSDIFRYDVDPIATIAPGARIVVSNNIRCTADLTAYPYTGDNANTYAGYGDNYDRVTVNIIVARLQITKSVTINASPDYVAQGGSAYDAVPGARLVYTIAWRNVGSARADNVYINDLLPTPHTTMTANVTSVNSVSGMYIQCSFNVAGTWTLTPSMNAQQIRVYFDEIPVNAAGTINYQVVIK